jgi:hypothetical protein
VTFVTFVTFVVKNKKTLIKKQGFTTLYYREMRKIHFFLFISIYFSVFFVVNALFGLKNTVNQRDYHNEFVYCAAQG